MKNKTALQAIDRPHYRYWQALYKALYSPLIYLDVAKRWKGMGVLYLFLLMAIASFPFSFRLTYEIVQYFHQQLHSVEQVPLLVVQEGKLVFDKPMPYLVKNKKGQVFTIIDTTDTVTHKSKQYPDLAFLFTKDTVYYWPPSLPLLGNVAQEKEKPTVYTFHKDMNTVLDGKTWVNYSGIKKTEIIFIALIYPIFVLLFFAIFTVFLFTFSLMAQLLAQLFFRYKLRYTEACRLLAVAATAPSCLWMFLLVYQILFRGIGLLLLIVLSIYFFFGIISIKRHSTKMVLF
jgi:hypothetical protein